MPNRLKPFPLHLGDRVEEVVVVRVRSARVLKQRRISGVVHRRVRGVFVVRWVREVGRQRDRLAPHVDAALVGRLKVHEDHDVEVAELLTVGQRAATRLVRTTAGFHEKSADVGALLRHDVDNAKECVRPPQDTARPRADLDTIDDVDRIGLIQEHEIITGIHDRNAVEKNRYRERVAASKEKVPPRGIGVFEPRNQVQRFVEGSKPEAIHLFARQHRNDGRCFLKRLSNLRRHEHAFARFEVDRRDDQLVIAVVGHELGFRLVVRRRYGSQTDQRGEAPAAASLY